jgi:hypothetical protein
LYSAIDMENILSSNENAATFIIPSRFDNAITKKGTDQIKSQTNNSKN